MPQDQPSSYVKVAGDRLVGPDGETLVLRGVGLGGFLNMENFITGYPANEETMRAAVVGVLGRERAQVFFDRLLEVFFTADDARLLADIGLNSVRIPVNYRHFEDDDQPFVIKEEGFRLLDRVVDAAAAHGLYSIIDLHALPGYQNQGWHSDNPTHRAGLWVHRHFQDRTVAIWEAIADRYKDNRWVAGYNPINEPADPTREVVGPFSKRLLDAIRAIDPHHTLFFDGNTYSTEFDVYGEPWDNTVYACHDYALAGFVRGGDYPGETDGVHVDKAYLEQAFEKRTDYMRRTGTPIWVGEFGPVYTGDPRRDAMRRQILSDQLEIYARHGASWALWTYKDVGLQGLVHVAPDSPYATRFGDLMAKKDRLGVDAWGSTGHGVHEVLDPVYDFIAAEFPDFDPYPWGRKRWIDTLLKNILLAQPMVPEYAELFRGLSGDALIALADSFSLANCVRRDFLLETIAADGRG